MFVLVKLINNYSQPLTYHVPDSIQSIICGSLVTVPIRNKQSYGFVINCFDTIHNETKFTIKNIISCEQFPQDHLYMPFIQSISTHYAIDPIILLSRIKTFLKQKNKPLLDVPLQKNNTFHHDVILTTDQQKIVDTITPLIHDKKYSPNVLYGVTGSGKTCIYEHLINETYKLNKSTILLLPEVTLAIQFQKLFNNIFNGTIIILGFHSATSESEKKTVWSMLIANKPFVLIGVHLPILLPINNLGLIIIDEEHEIGFQEKKHPKLNSKEIAIMRAQQYNIPIILGSATPSITSLYNVQSRQWKLHTLTQRFSGSYPTIKIVKLNTPFQRKNFWISKDLEQAIQQRLLRKEQIIIFLNRRGICFFLQCAQCSHVINCKQCSVSLTVHENNTLKCHYCDFKQLIPQICLICKTNKFINKGIGTQKIVDILQKLFPLSKIARADHDTTINKKTWQDTITNFENGEIDILVGTQTITKGYHFPHVTLVGIIWADLNLNFPIFNAQETTIQQLIQVAGRAGRMHHKSEVIVQTMGDCPLFDYLSESKYLLFYQSELTSRKLIGYPPIKRLVEIELKHKSEAIVESESILIANHFMNFDTITTLGPTAPMISKIKTIFSRRIYLKSLSFTHIQKAFTLCDTKKIRSKIFFTPHPLS